jgi:hypothetical protein
MFLDLLTDVSEEPSVYKVENYSSNPDDRERALLRNTDKDT